MFCSWLGLFDDGKGFVVLLPCRFPMKVLRSRIIVYGLALLLLAGTYAGAQTSAQGPMGLFNVLLPRGWILQVARSDWQLHVYHAAEAPAALYLEVQEAAYDDLYEAADRITAMYQSPWGLKEFAVVTEPLPLNLDGVEAVRLAYSYRLDSSQRVMETRVLALYQGMLVSAALAKSETEPTPEALDKVLDSWRWSYAE